MLEYALDYVRYAASMNPWYGILTIASALALLCAWERLHYGMSSSVDALPLPVGAHIVSKRIASTPSFF